MAHCFPLLDLNGQISRRSHEDDFATVDMRLLSTLFGRWQFRYRTRSNSFQLVVYAGDSAFSIGRH